jgi:DnaK suppressor protein
MTKQELDRLQEGLDCQRADILRTLISIQREGRGVRQDSPEDLGERSVSNLSKELLFQQAAQKRTLLRSIEAALERIRQGNFGLCVNCENEIGIKRLEAIPFSPYCRDCQESLEREGSFFNEEAHVSTNR